jgi:2-polyprenyl-6-methoxyphenol hydroxylase-like FAD-dependent oxidoreductase
MDGRPGIEPRYEAVVVGARVAGASTALLLARAGLSVLAVERSARGSDTTSTHALMRSGVLQLHRWGVLPRLVAAGTPPVRATTFHYGDEVVAVPTQARDGVDALYAARRTVLDAALVDAAVAHGAHVVHGVRVEGLARDRSGRVCGVDLADGAGARRRVAADIVVGADGARSVVARAAGAEVVRAGRHATALVYGYWRLPLDGTHWYYGKGVAAGAIPTNDGLACVFVGMRPGRYAGTPPGELDALVAAVLAEVDGKLARAVVGATREGNLHPFPGRPGFLRKAWGPGWALVGDAGCFKDPLTAHGMTDALRDATLLAAAVAAGTEGALRRYAAVRDPLAAEFLEISDEVASLDWDFERVKALHHRLSRAMGREYDLLRSLGHPRPAAAPALAG